MRSHLAGRRRLGSRGVTQGGDPLVGGIKGGSMAAVEVGAAFWLLEQDSVSSRVTLHAGGL